MKEVTKDRVPSKDSEWVSFSELPKALSNQGKVRITYRVGDSGVIIHPSGRECSELVIEGVVDKNKEIETQEQMQELMKVMSENGDFGLTLKGEVFNAPLDFSKINLRIVSLHDARLTTALEDVKAMIVRLEADPNDLQYEEFSDVNCKAIFALAEEKNSELCKKAEFKKLFTIASIVINKKIEISDDEVLQGVLWFMKNSKSLAQIDDIDDIYDEEDLRSVKWYIRNSKNPAQFVVNRLQNEQYFDALVKEMKSSESRGCIIFVQLNVSAAAVAEYIQLGDAYVSRFGEKNVFALIPWKPSSANPVVCVLNFYNKFELDMLRQYIEVTKVPVRLSFIDHKFSLSEVEYLVSLPAEKIRSVSFESFCEFTTDAKACLFKKGQVLMSRVDSGRAIYQEYIQYLDAHQRLDRIKSFIAKYRNNTLEYTELMRDDIKGFILGFRCTAEELTASEREDIMDLSQIVTFRCNDDVVIYDDRMFRVVQWMMMHANRSLEDIYVNNVDEACALIRSFERKIHQNTSAVIKLEVNDSHSMTIDCLWEGTVTLSMTGVPQNADVFNKIVNSVSSTVRLDFSEDQFLPDMDLSNPGINSIKKAREESCNTSEAQAPQQYHVPPVAYPPAAPIPRQATLAELMDGQRRAESNPVLQGVAPTQAPAPSGAQQEKASDEKKKLMFV